MSKKDGIVIALHVCEKVLFTFHYNYDRSKGNTSTEFLLHRIEVDLLLRATTFSLPSLALHFTTMLALCQSIWKVRKKTGIKLSFFHNRFCSHEE